MEVINFVGTGISNGKEVEVHFKTTLKNISWDKEDRENPKIVIEPLLNKEKEVFVEIFSK